MDVSSNNAQDWIVAMGNEAGGEHCLDLCFVRRSERCNQRCPRASHSPPSAVTFADLDSMVSALALAYTLSHDLKNPQKAVALLQTEQGELTARCSALGFRAHRLLSP
jgi:hypothetical protein